MFQPLSLLLQRTLLTLLLVSAATVASTANLLETAEQSGEFKGFVEAARESGVDAILEKDGPYTVFAPTDEAISRFGEDRWAQLAQDKERMSRMLKHHIIPGKVMITEVRPGRAETLAGTRMELQSDNGLVKAGTANVIQSDISADNGVIHAMDQIIETE